MLVILQIAYFIYLVVFLPQGSVDYITNSDKVLLIPAHGVVHGQVKQVHEVEICLVQVTGGTYRQCLWVLVTLTSLHPNHASLTPLSTVFSDILSGHNLKCSA